MSSENERDASIVGTLVRIEDLAGRAADGVDELRKVLLVGNGTPAITVQVATLNADMANVKAAVAEHKVPRAVWIPMAVTALLALIGMVIEARSLIGH